MYQKKKKNSPFELEQHGKTLFLLTSTRRHHNNIVLPILRIENEGDVYQRHIRLFLLGNEMQGRVRFCALVLDFDENRFLI